MKRLTCLLAALATAAVALGPPAQARNAPFSDSAAVGLLTLCDTRGHELTHGDTRIKPFAWRAVGSARGPQGYDVNGASATLFGYQPLRGVDPVNWQGEYLTGSGTYTDLNHPMAAATAADPTLSDYVRDYPAKWDGLVQLRLFLGSPQAPTLTTSYNAAVLRVRGTTWSVVSGGHGGCGTGTSRSDELILPRVRKLGTPAPNAVTDKPGQPGLGGAPTSVRSAATSSRASTPVPSRSRDSAPRRPTAVPSGTPVAAQSAGASPVASSSPSSDSSALPWVLGGLALLVLLGAAGAVAARRRRTPARRP